MPVREMANPIPVLTGSEYRDMKTIKKHIMQNIAGMKSGTYGQMRKANMKMTCRGEKDVCSLQKSGHIEQIEQN